MSKEDLTEIVPPKTELDLNEILANAEINAVANYNPNPTLPVCFIVGAPSSGTTFILQWLAATNAFTYPTNLISKFYMAPFIGAKIQKMLSETDSSPLNRIGHIDKNWKAVFESDLGKTDGLLAPNEFNKFWERFFPSRNDDGIKQKKDSYPNMLILGSELAALESVYNKPIVMKAVSLNSQIEQLAKQIPNAIFLFIKRDTFFNIQSLLIQRRKLEGTADWVSYKPPQYKKLKKLNIYKQLAGQVHFTNKLITKGLMKVPKHQKLIFNYEDFCVDPIHFWGRLNNRFNKLGFTLHKNYDGLDSFTSLNKIKVDKKEKDRIAAAYYSLFGDDITPK
ncbi:MAG: hypothetical protein D8M58_01485 [Calditrichaeota bacterium]|nr:MAG: hypothetical protein DWQ03_05595 [Calditrichota bacterium]MBL1204041.1 hypothetical protein [Calditrichota bacterium]NOG43872.1 hypothetical protein [Calditrichota bacterium]